MGRTAAAQPTAQQHWEHTTSSSGPSVSQASHHYQLSGVSADHLLLLMADSSCCCCTSWSRRRCGGWNRQTARMRRRWPCAQQHGEPPPPHHHCPRCYPPPPPLQTLPRPLPATLLCRLPRCRRLPSPALLLPCRQIRRAAAACRAAPSAAPPPAHWPQPGSASDRLRVNVVCSECRQQQLMMISQANKHGRGSKLPHIPQPATRRYRPTQVQRQMMSESGRASISAGSNPCAHAMWRACKYLQLGTCGYKQSTTHTQTTPYDAINGRRNVNLMHD